MMSLKSELSRIQAEHRALKKSQKDTELSINVNLSEPQENGKIDKTKALNKGCDDGDIAASRAQSILRFRR